MCGFFIAIERNSSFSSDLEKIDLQKIQSYLYQRSDQSDNVNTQWSFAFNSSILTVHAHLSIANPGSFTPYPLKSDKSLFLFNGEIYSISSRPPDESYLTDGHFFFDYLSNIDLSSPSYKRRLFCDVSGQFAFTLLSKGKLIIGRDLFGQKPLYWLELDNYILVSSLESIILSAYLDLIGSNLSLIKPSAHLDLATFPGVVKVIPASLVAFDLLNPNSNPSTYSFLNDVISNPYSISHYSFSSDADIVNTFINSVDLVFPSQPSTLAISAGLDSTNIAFALKYLSKSPSAALTVSTPSNQFEVNKVISNNSFFDFPLQIITPDPAILSSVMSPFPMDNASGALATLCATTFARGAKVMLTGDGGDELSQRYRRTLYCRLFSLIPRELRYLLSPLLSFNSYPLAHLICFKLFSPSIQSDLARTASQLFQLDCSVDFGQMTPFLYEFLFHMPEHILSKTDIISYSQMVEVRSPYLTNEFGLRALATLLESKNYNYSAVISKHLAPASFLPLSKMGLVSS